MISKVYKRACNREMVTITRKAYDILRKMVNARKDEGEAATLLSVASEIIIKAGQDAEAKCLLG